ncbi:Sexual differentiation process protein isp4 [Ceratocystis fimbriata CBS 114723]|uniref:Sexual differentiation process protein isp4 n=2 Tax=Ceratocystis TaxID=5157 RepID=A0A0F8B1Y1_CERFI|nr:Sexual differentiation process protein isp4 [Ceratocystis platani]PHH49515.1 Sexual differentiation process protein isp4 [Ceratocystis fimbriata CBS 114723]
MARSSASKAASGSTARSLEPRAAYSKSKALNHGSGSEAKATHDDDDDDDGGFSENEGLLAPSSDGIELRHLHHKSKPINSNSDSDATLPVSSDSDEDGDWEENSPYPEVRAAVHNYDEEMPCDTVRVWVIGLGLVVFGASMNSLFSLRSPSISVSALLAQVIAWPLGHGWALLVPNCAFNIFGRELSLNPGPFNIKEHTIIVIMASVSFSVAYATDIILAQRIFYKQNFGLVWQLMLTVSSQSVGYGIAGMLRRFLVYPASMIWPGNLAAITLMNAMYEKVPDRDPSVLGGNMLRYHWFGLMVGASFLYYFIPGFLAQFLSVFSIVTWFAPKNVAINQLFGGENGLSLLPLTFDWTQITGYVGSPLVPPWVAIFNTLIGVVGFYIILTALLHFSNTWYSHYLPISDSATYDNLGHKYDTSRILSPEMTLDENAYKNYSPLFISTTFAMAYGLSFAAIASLVVYTWLHHRHQIINQWRDSTHEKPDIHMKLMRKYPEAPTWWYMSLFGIMMCIGFITVLGYPTNLSWWAFLLAIFLAFLFALPVGIIQAVTNNQIGLNVLTEFIYGYIQPGRPLALMLFKTYGFITMSQALNFVSDLKLGHYMKIPPRTLFLTQVVATTVSCFVQVFTLSASLATIPNVCEADQADHFTCPGGRVFFSASVIWGLIGPARVFSPGQIYYGLFWFFIIGAITPVLLFYGAKRWPRSFMKNLIAPLIFGGAGAIPPATPLNYLSWGIVGYFFQYHLRKVHPRWWTRLNFLTASGLDLGLALATVFAFFAFTMHGIEGPDWWGNRLGKNTLDAQGGAVLIKLPEGQAFGPKSW